MSRSIMLTTIDNPYDPFNEFDLWFKFDCLKGYNSCSKIARLSKVTDEMSSKEEDLEVERAIKRLVEIDPLDIYKIVHKNDKNINNNEEKENKD